MNQKSTYSKIMRSLAVAMLLGSYLSAFLFSELHSVLSHDHSHTHESCSVEAEKDPCHRLIFHNDFQGECEHEGGHFHSPKHECELCDALIAQFDFPKITTTDIEIFKSESPDITFEEKIIIHFSYPSILLRGPPVMNG